MHSFLSRTAEITGNGQGINVSFSNATRNYSRLRIATMPNKPITVTINKYTPAGSSSMEWFQDIALTSDEKGNAYLYGNFVTNSIVNVEYGGALLATHHFYEVTGNAKSYALDATVVLLADEGITYDQIVEDVKKELDAGKTYINLILAPDVDEETLEAINIGLKDARDGSINLTLIGCKKIPSRGFMHFGMLKSIVLPDVTEIEENAFSDCPGLQKVVLGNLTKVYGNVRNNGIFDGCETRFIDLVLSKDQKVMNDGEAEGRYCWTADIITDYDLSDEHVSKKFLGYEFKSITCRYKFE